MCFVHACFYSGCVGSDFSKFLLVCLFIFLLKKGPSFKPSWLFASESCHLLSCFPLVLHHTCDENGVCNFNCEFGSCGYMQPVVIIFLVQSEVSDAEDALRARALASLKRRSSDR